MFTNKLNANEEMRGGKKMCTHTQKRKKIHCTIVVWKKKKIESMNIALIVHSHPKP